MKASLFTSIIAIGMASTLTGSALAAPPEGKGKKGRIAIAAELVSVDCTTSEALKNSDQGTIMVGSDAQSCYNYEIAITSAAHSNPLGNPRIVRVIKFLSICLVRS